MTRESYGSNQSNNAMWIVIVGLTSGTHVAGLTAEGKRWCMGLTKTRVGVQFNYILRVVNPTQAPGEREFIEGSQSVIGIYHGGLAPDRWDPIGNSQLENAMWAAVVGLTGGALTAWRVWGPQVRELRFNFSFYRCVVKPLQEQKGNPPKTSTQRLPPVMVVMSLTGGVWSS